MEEIILKERKFREDLTKLINNSQIPAVMIISILKDALPQLVELEELQYNKAKESTQKLEKGE